jgi:hypothetical protein
MENATCKTKSDGGIDSSLKKGSRKVYPTHRRKGRVEQQKKESLGCEKDGM